MKFSESRIAISVVPHAAKWPEAGTTIAWAALHDAVAALRNVVAGVDEQVTAVERDSDLSDQGRCRSAGPS